MRIATKGIFAVKYEPVKHLRPPPPKWRSVFCRPQNTLPVSDHTARRGGFSRAVCSAAPFGGITRETARVKCERKLLRG